MVAQKWKMSKALVFMYLLMVANFLYGSPRGDLQAAVLVIVIFTLLALPASFSTVTLRLSSDTVFILIFLCYFVVSSRDGSGIRSAVFLIIAFSGYIIMIGRKVKLTAPFVFFSILLASILISHINYGGDFLNVNPNFAGAFSAYVIIILSMYFRLSIVKISLLILIAFAITTSKSLAGSLLVTLVLYMLIHAENIAQKIAASVFLALSVTGAIVFIVGYNEFIIVLNQIALEHTGRRFESGRLEIWSHLLLNASWIDLIIGHGTIPRFTGFDEMGALSAHSSYVFLIYRVGIIGLVFFVAIIVAICRKLHAESLNRSLFFIIFLVTRDFFEISLVGNFLASAFFVWTFVATGVLERRGIRPRTFVTEYDPALTTGRPRAPS